HATPPHSGLTLVTLRPRPCYRLFFCPTPPTTESYPLSLHDALPIFQLARHGRVEGTRALRLVRADLFERVEHAVALEGWQRARQDRKSTRLNSSHLGISYAVFCLKKKKNHTVTLLETLQVAESMRTG